MPTTRPSTAWSGVHTRLLPKGRSAGQAHALAISYIINGAAISAGRNRRAYALILIGKHVALWPHTTRHTPRADRPDPAQLPASEALLRPSCLHDSRSHHRAQPKLPRCPAPSPAQAHAPLAPLPEDDVCHASPALLSISRALANELRARENPRHGAHA